MNRFFQSESKSLLDDYKVLNLVHSVETIGRLPKGQCVTFHVTHGMSTFHVDFIRFNDWVRLVYTKLKRHWIRKRVLLGPGVTQQKYQIICRWRVKNKTFRKRIKWWLSFDKYIDETQINISIRLSNFYVEKKSRELVILNVVPVNSVQTPQTYNQISLTIGYFPRFISQRSPYEVSLVRPECLLFLISFTRPWSLGLRLTPLMADRLLINSGFRPVIDTLVSVTVLHRCSRQSFRVYTKWVQNKLLPISSPSFYWHQNDHDCYG